MASVPFRPAGIDFMPGFASYELHENMNTEPIPKFRSRDQMERDTLRLLCSALVEPGTRLEICRLLQPQDFLDPLRKTVFEELRAAGLIRSSRLPAFLTARMIHRGFPSFDLDELLAPGRAKNAEIEQLFESALRLLKLDGTSVLSSSVSEADVHN